MHPISVGTVRLKEKWTSVRWRGVLQMRNKDSDAEAPSQARKSCDWYIGCYPAWSNQILPLVLYPDGSQQLHGAGPDFPLHAQPTPQGPLLTTPPVGDFARDMVGAADPFAACKAKH